jgi:mono/diheme cytochrome c family protein
VGSRLRRAALRTAALLTVPCAALAAVFVASERRLQKVYDVPAPAVSVPADPAAVARGRHLAHAVAQCAYCHGDDLGGKLAADVAGLGRLYAPNLTPGRGGIGASYRDADFVRAIRHGVDREGRALWVMPSQYLAALRDVDLGALIAYLRTLAPVDRELPAKRAGWLTRLALVTGRAPDLLPAEQIDHAALAEAARPSRHDAQRGAYLVDLGACRVCHRPDLSGGLHPLALPGEPTPPSLRAAGPLARWSEADFVRAMRTGATPTGRLLDPQFMPWPRFAGMSDGELRAIWRYLRPGA